MSSGHRAVFARPIQQLVRLVVTPAIANLQETAASRLNPGVRRSEGREGERKKKRSLPPFFSCRSIFADFLLAPGHRRRLVLRARNSPVKKRAPVTSINSPPARYASYTGLYICKRAWRTWNIHVVAPGGGAQRSAAGFDLRAQGSTVAVC